MLPVPKPRAVPWVGGKARPRVTRWICERLGSYVGGVYCEPYGGMCAMLLARPRSRVEIICDISGLVTDFWLVVIDPADRAVLEDRLSMTPCRVEGVLDEALRLAADQTATRLERGWALLVVTRSGFMAAPEQTVAAGHRKFAPSFDQSPRSHAGTEIGRLAERMAGVQVVNGDGTALIEKLADNPKALIYCDPPYPSAEPGLYGPHTVDRDRMAAAVLRCEGRVAVSGDPEDWPQLTDAGWRMDTLPVSGKPGGGGSARQRTEALWLNPRLASESAWQATLWG